MIGVSIADVCSDGLSSVYMYFEPNCASRSLGTYSIIKEIEFCRLQGFDYYYLGYYVAESKTMAYKSRFRPNQVLSADGQWHAFK